ncbi:MAG: formamidopyrimidine-DNA glycosylase [Frankiaceae bacterium]|nr:formamidopyrimidine-DNA glycosylase [Frankiaceae bacterium]
MPELPEVESLARYLSGRMLGRHVAGLELASIAALKTYDPPPSALAGLEVTGLGRRGKFLYIDVDGVFFVLHLARAGWLRWYDELSPKPPRPGGPIALRLRLAEGGGFDATEAGTKKGLAAYVVRQLSDVPGIAGLGIDPLDPGFDVVAFAAMTRGRGSQVKGLLTDQQTIAGVGNAYSDEALHVAKLSPFKTAASLTDDEVARLHDALVAVLADAVERSKDTPAGELKSEKKSGLRVHGKTGLPCPVCGDTVREVSFADKSLQYCPTCQTGGKPLADRRLSRLLK